MEEGAGRRKSEVRSGKIKAQNIYKLFYFLTSDFRLRTSSPFFPRTSDFGLPACIQQ
jgi:hypothetical protein